MESRWIACIPLGAAVIAWLLTPQSYPPALGAPPPLATTITQVGWGEVPWPRAATFRPAELRQFERDGYIVLRKFLSFPIVKQLRSAHSQWCKLGASSPHWHCKNEDVWARTDTYRDFLYYGPIGRTVKNLLQVRGVRIYGDHIAEMRPEHRGIFYHFDNIYYGGVLGEFHANTKGAVVFVFVTGVASNITGGSVLLQPGGHRDNCVMAGVDPQLQAPCRERFYERAIALSFNAGDALIIHPLMPHASQEPLPTAPVDFRRLTYLARIVETDAIFCATDEQVRETGKVDCRHTLRPGDKAHHVCYSQICPLLLDEVLERTGADWFSTTCNVHPGWRYTSLKRLRLRVGSLVGQLRIRLRGGTPLGLERAECTYPPEQLGLFG